MAVGGGEPVGERGGDQRAQPRRAGQLGRGAQVLQGPLQGRVGGDGGEQAAERHGRVLGVGGAGGATGAAGPPSVTDARRIRGPGAGQVRRRGGDGVKRCRSREVRWSGWRAAGRWGSRRERRGRRGQHALPVMTCRRHQGFRPADVISGTGSGQRGQQLVGRRVVVGQHGRVLDEGVERGAVDHLGEACRGRRRPAARAGGPAGAGPAPRRRRSCRRRRRPAPPAGRRARRARTPRGSWPPRRRRAGSGGSRSRSPPAARRAAAPGRPRRRTPRWPGARAPTGCRRRRRRPGRRRRRPPRRRRRARRRPGPRRRGPRRARARPRRGVGDGLVDLEHAAGGAGPGGLEPARHGAAAQPEVQRVDGPVGQDLVDHRSRTRWCRRTRGRSGRRGRRRRGAARPGAASAARAGPGPRSATRRQ